MLGKAYQTLDTPIVWGYAGTVHRSRPVRHAGPQPKEAKPDLKEVQMNPVRRLITIVISCATWIVAAATVAVAKGTPDLHPVIARSPQTAPLVGDQWWNAAPVAPSTSATGLPLWQFLALVALAVLMAVAIVGLGYSLSHSRRSESSQPPLRA